MDEVIRAIGAGELSHRHQWVEIVMASDGDGDALRSRSQTWTLWLQATTSALIARYK